MAASAFIFLFLSSFFPLFSSLIPTQPTPPPPIDLPGPKSGAYASFGVWWLKPQETIEIRIDVLADDTRATSGCGEVKANGYVMALWNYWVPVNSDVVVAVNPAWRLCYIEIVGQNRRCVGTGCPVRAEHWADNPALRPAAFPVLRYAAALGESGLVSAAMFALFGSLLGFVLVKAILEIGYRMYMDHYRSSLGDEYDEEADRYYRRNEDIFDDSDDD
jgi:hypothetical protein